MPQYECGNGTEIDIKPGPWGISETRRGYEMTLPVVREVTFANNFVRVLLPNGEGLVFSMMGITKLNIMKYDPKAGTEPAEESVGIVSGNEEW